MNVVLLAREEVGPDGIVRLVDARARHVIDVLRVTPGQDVRVGIVDGPLGIGTVTAVGDASVELRCAFDATIPSRPAIDLLLALPRPKVMRRARRAPLLRRARPLAGHLHATADRGPPAGA
jgi:16S rRNA U1498 N3-methylase RsmE